MFCLLFSLGSGRTSTRPTSSLETKTPGMLSMCSHWDSKVPCIYRASLLSNDHIFILIFDYLRLCQNYNSVSGCLFFLCSLLSSKFQHRSSGGTSGLFLANIERNVSKSENLGKTSLWLFFFFFFESAADTDLTCHDEFTWFKSARGSSDVLPTSPSYSKSAKSHSWAGWHTLRWRDSQNTPKNLSCLCFFSWNKVSMLYFSRKLKIRISSAYACP